MYFDQNCINLERSETSVPYPGLPHIPPVIQRTSFNDDAQRPSTCLTFINSLSSHSYRHKGDSLVAQMVKRLPTMWDTRVRSLGQEDPLEKEMATHSSILAWRIPWTEEPDRLQAIGPQGVRRN